MKAAVTISAPTGEFAQGQQRRHTLTFVPALAPAQSRPARTAAAHGAAVACSGQLLSGRAAQALRSPEEKPF